MVGLAAVGLIPKRFSWRCTIDRPPRGGPEEKRDDRQPRVNNQIRISPVRLIGPEGEQIGIVSIDEARDIARDAGLDLVEVAPNARPAVVKVMDFGKWKYEQSKNAAAARKHEHTITVKQVKFRPFIDDHDFEIKTNMARRFLEEGSKVKITVMFQRRALRRPESGFLVLDRVAQGLQDIGRVESRPNEIINRDLTMIIGPLNAAPGSGAPGQGAPQGPRRPPPSPFPSAGPSMGPGMGPGYGPGPGPGYNQGPGPDRNMGNDRNQGPTAQPAPGNSSERSGSGSSGPGGVPPRS